MGQCGWGDFFLGDISDHVMGICVREIHEDKFLKNFSPLEMVLKRTEIFRQDVVVNDSSVFTLESPSQVRKILLYISFTKNYEFSLI